VAPCFLIDENLSPLLAGHLRYYLGFDTVHVNEVSLRVPRTLTSLPARSPSTASS
jgi:hypothetical protein